MATRKQAIKKTESYVAGLLINELKEALLLNETGKMDRGQTLDSIINIITEVKTHGGYAEQNISFIELRKHYARKILALVTPTIKN